MKHIGTAIVIVSGLMSAGLLYGVTHIRHKVLQPTQTMAVSSLNAPTSATANVPSGVILQTHSSDVIISQQAQYVMGKIKEEPKVAKKHHAKKTKKAKKQRRRYVVPVYGLFGERIQ